MSTVELNSKAQELRELRRMQEELEAEINAIQDLFKLEMANRNADELTGADWKVTWKAVTSSRLDTAALKKALPDVAAAFTRSSTSRRFVLA